MYFKSAAIFQLQIIVTQMEEPQKVIFGTTRAFIYLNHSTCVRNEGCFNMQQYSAEDAIPSSQPPHAVTAVQM